jgi:hypothetical protein
METTAHTSTCPYFQACLRDGHASAICLINCEAKYRSCRHRPDWKNAELMQLVEDELARLMRMEIDELIEVRLTRYAAEAESPKLISEIRRCLKKIGELAE